MNAKERKDKIKDLINQVEDLISDIKKGESNVKAIINKAYELDGILNELGSVDGWDIDELSKNIFISFMNGTNFDNVSEQIQDFKSELEEYMDELSEARREKLEEKYEDLDSVNDIFTLDNYENFEDIKYSLDDAVDYLKGMI